MAPVYSPVEDSILTTIKKMLGLTPDYTVFDMEIVVHINAALAVLNQRGVGPYETFEITGPDEKWEEFIQGKKYINNVKQYIYYRVRLVFDPPTTAHSEAAFKQLMDEAEFRLDVAEDERQNGR